MKIPKLLLIYWLFVCFQNIIVYPSQIARALLTLSSSQRGLHQKSSCFCLQGGTPRRTDWRHRSGCGTVGHLAKDSWPPSQLLLWPGGSTQKKCRDQALASSLQADERGDAAGCWGVHFQDTQPPRVCPEQALRFSAPKSSVELSLRWTTAASESGAWRRGSSHWIKRYDFWRKWFHQLNLGWCNPAGNNCEHFHLSAVIFSWCLWTQCQSCSISIAPGHLSGWEECHHIYVCIAIYYQKLWLRCKGWSITGELLFLEIA